MSKSICVHCTEPELETREKRRALFSFVGPDVENAQHIEVDTSAGIKEGTINDLNAVKVSAIKAAEIGECCLGLLSSLFFSSVVALSLRICVLISRFSFFFCALSKIYHLLKMCLSVKKSVDSKFVRLNISHLSTANIFSIELFQFHYVYIRNYYNFLYYYSAEQQHMLPNYSAMQDTEEGPAVGKKQEGLDTDLEKLYEADRVSACKELCLRVSRRW